MKENKGGNKKNRISNAKKSGLTISCFRSESLYYTAMRY